MLASGDPVEIVRKVQRDGLVSVGGLHCKVGFALAGRTIALRLDGHHACHRR